MAELAAAHPDLAGKTQRIELVRYGHAMAVPVPGNLSQISLWPASVLCRLLLNKEHPALVFEAAPRLAFAHADWSGYSVFEEAFTLGHAAGMAFA